MRPCIEVVVNGRTLAVPEGCTVSELLRQLRITGRCAVEINRQVAPRSTHASCRLKSGDRIEIVHAIGGG